MNNEQIRQNHGLLVHTPQSDREAILIGCIIHRKLFTLPIGGEACKHYCSICYHLTAWRRRSDCLYHYIASCHLDEDSIYLCCLRKMLSIKCSNVLGTNQDGCCKDKSYIFNLPVFLAEIRKWWIRNKKYGGFGLSVTFIVTFFSKGVMKTNIELEKK